MNENYIANDIQLWNIERLGPASRNARTHSKKQIQEIAGSIAAYGFMNPLVVDADGTIVAGNARYLAARQLGLDRVPVIVA